MIFYGWFIVAASFLILMVSWGSNFSFSVFLIPLIEEFGWSRASTAGVFSLNILLFGVGALFSGWMVERYGPRAVNIMGALLVGGGLVLNSTIQALWQLYLFNGVIIGFGVSFGYGPLVATTARWFSARRGLAMGIMAVGISIGMILFPPLSRSLITEFGWRKAFVILGIICGAAMLASALVLRKNPADKGLRPYGEGPISIPGVSQHPSSADLTLSQAMGTSSFWIFFAGYLLWLVGFLMISIHLAAYGTDRGLSPMAAAFGVSLIGAGSIFGKILMGLLSDRIGPQKVLVINLLMQGLAIIALGGTGSPLLLYIFSLIIGFGYGGTGPQLPVLAARLFGLSNLGSIFGALLLSGQIGGAIGSLTAGRIFDLTHSYFIAFLIGGMAVTISALMIYLVKAPRSDSPPSS